MTHISRSRITPLRVSRFMAFAFAAGAVAVSFCSIDERINPPRVEVFAARDTASVERSNVRTARRRIKNSDASFIVCKPGVEPGNVIAELPSRKGSNGACQTAISEASLLAKVKQGNAELKKAGDAESTGWNILAAAFALLSITIIPVSRAFGSVIGSITGANPAKE